jgi:predicted DNA-binding helix-hairpin-helix protein
MPVIHDAMGQLASRIAQSRVERRETSTAPEFAPAGQSTQMIVGATTTSDAQVLATASELYERHKLRRVYYSAYSPIPDCDGRLPSISPPLMREHRLYQADWLVRFYGFKAAELTTATQQNLDLNADPKLSWALRHREFFPIDVNRAGRGALLRVPGIGARNVARILKLRRLHRVRLDDLSRLHISLKRAKPFVITADYNPELLRLDDDKLVDRVLTPDRQLRLFEASASATTGEV